MPLHPQLIRRWVNLDDVASLPPMDRHARRAQKAVHHTGHHLDRRTVPRHLGSNFKCKGFQAPKGLGSDLLSASAKSRLTLTGLSSKP